MDQGYIVRWQSYLVYTIGKVLPVYDKPYDMNNEFQQMLAEIKNVWNHALVYDSAAILQLFGFG